jgi:signal transduction histidine kinase
MYNLVTQALDGNIEASSEPGQGLRYEIRFPART